MTAEVVDIGVKKWADTCEEIVVLYGTAEVNKRCSALPKEYRRKIIDELENRSLEREFNSE